MTKPELPEGLKPFEFQADPFPPVTVNQTMVWFDSNRHKAVIETFPCTVFKFEICTNQLINLQPSGLANAETRTVHGTLSFVTKLTDLIGKPFLLLIYNANKRVAEIHDAMFTEYTQEYMLGDKYVYDAKFYAAKMRTFQSS